MGKKEKLWKRLQSKPKDFTYAELVLLLSYFGYEEDNVGKTSGSAVRFVHPTTKHILRIHKPHPENTLKMYVIKYVLDELSKEGAVI